MSYYPDQRRDSQRSRRSGGMSGIKLRLIIGGAIVLFAVVSYVAKGQVNPITGEKQRVDLSIDDEIMMGLQSAPQMGRQSSDRNAQNRVDEIGSRLVNTLETSLYNAGKTNPFRFEFHLLDDKRSVNAFALPGGQVFITEALYHQLNNEGQVAGVLGHEIGHVLERHGSQRMAKGSLIKGIASAAGVAGGGSGSGQAAAYVGNIVNMKYGRQDELESDRWGVELMIATGYDPEHLLAVMDVLEKSAGGGGTPEFMSTHPRPANRKQYIQDIIAERFPNGMPGGLR